jgi:hypothetical protein
MYADVKRDAMVGPLERFHYTFKGFCSNLRTFRVCDVTHIATCVVTCLAKAV